MNARVLVFVGRWFRVRRTLGFAWLGVVTACGVGCGAHAASATQLARVSLPNAAGSESTLPAAAPARLTVIEFFSANCDCQAAHDARLAALQRDYAARGVAFFAVDSEVDASSERDAKLSRERSYAYPLLIDHDAQLANQLGAEYSTYTVIVDAQGNVRYRGGIDSDDVQLHDDAQCYLRDALDDLLAGHEPRHANAKALGCALRTR